MKFNTKVVRAAIHPEAQTGAVIPPIFQTATYVLDEVGTNKGFDYSRSSNPTRQNLEECLAALEGASYGVCFASGMSTVDACLRLLSAGDHVVCSDDVYGGVSRLFNDILTRYGLTFTFVNSSEAEEVERAIQENTKLIWIETPTNPLLKVTDLEAVAAIAKKHHLLLGVDSTFATPALLRPLEYGVDLVVHSTTKYLSGHNQLIGGTVLTQNEELYEQLKFMQRAIGAVPGPFDCFLTMLGLKTLSLRMARHSENAMQVALFLESHPKVARVSYPGLPSHPQHAIAKAQMSDFSGMISFELEGGFKSGEILMNKLKLCSLAESLGAVDTMITHPASMTHAAVPKKERLARGLTDGLVRISVGIEDVEDIIADLKQGLE